MIVADANLLIYLLVPGPLTQKAEIIRAKERTWIVPPLLSHELLNVLARCIHKKLIARDEAIRAYRRGLAMVEISDKSADIVALLNMAMQSGCSTYDLEYVWLAKDSGLVLVTADREIIGAFPDLAVDLDHFN